MGDVRIIANPTTSASEIFGYLLRSPFGGDGWITSVDNMEDYYWWSHLGLEVC